MQNLPLFHIFGFLSVIYCIKIIINLNTLNELATSFSQKKWQIEVLFNLILLFSY